ncbi:MAG: carbohydrate-binding domain-containing protein, partial [Clostridiales bacterium]|nr:carbohydrate-binding domain-containing protein [Clostridiales bacterium]
MKIKNGSKIYRACAACLACVVALSLASCSAASAPDKPAETARPENSATKAPTSQATPSPVTQASFEDVDSDAGVQSATTITLENDKASIVGPGAAFSQGLVKITEAGTYELSGTFTGQILVDAAKTDVVRLALKNLNITNPKGSAIYSKKAQKTVLILLEKTENSVTDGTGYTFEAGTDEPNSAIFSKDSLSITGDGKLTVDGKYNMAIESKDVLTITGGEITATSVGDALRGHDG